MKTNTKNKFIPRLFAVVLFFSISFPVMGQEFIRGAIDYYLCDTSIVRQISADTVLVYNSNQTSTFSFVVATQTNMWTLYYEPLYVNDFEIYKEKVYFCGYMREEGVKYAIIGYFKLNDYPFINLYYYKVSDCEELKKLDVYTIMEIYGIEEVHLVATGTTSGVRSDAIVDMSMSAVPTNCDIYISNDENQSFDDVAATKNYVAVAARNKVQGIPVVDFLFFKRPGHTWQSIFSSNANIFRVTSPTPDSPVVLEHTKVDSVAAVYKIAGFSQMAMLRTEALNTNYQIYQITAGQSWPAIPIDIKYHKPTSNYAILARTGNRQDPDFDPPMHIYHVTPADLNGTSLLGNGTRYTEVVYHLWSLEPQRGFSPQFFISGDAGQIPYLFRIYNNQWGKCTDRFGYFYANGNLKGEWEEKALSPRSYYLEIQQHEPRDKRPIPFPVECDNEE